MKSHSVKIDSVKIESVRTRGTNSNSILSLRHGWQFGLAFPVRCAPQSRSTAPHDTDLEAVAEIDLPRSTTVSPASISCLSRQNVALSDKVSSIEFMVEMTRSIAWAAGSIETGGRESVHNCAIKMRAASGCASNYCYTRHVQPHSRVKSTGEV